MVGVSGRGDYLLSAGTDDIVNIYNMKSTLLERELNLGMECFEGLTGVIKLAEGESEMVISDILFGLTWFSFDLNNSDKHHPDISYKPVVKLFDQISDNKNIFGATDNKGQIKIYKRDAFENEEEDAENVEINELHKFRGHKGEITGISYFKDGTFVSCGVDGTYKIWTSRKDVLKIGKVGDGKSGC